MGGEGEDPSSSLFILLTEMGCSKLPGCPWYPPKFPEGSRFPGWDMWSVKHFADSFDAFLLSTHQFRAGAGNLYRAATGVQKQVYKEIKINTEKN